MIPYSQKAICLANAPYLAIVFLDAAGTDDEGYVSLHPELAGCMSQGDTPEEALANLEDARQLYIQSLLDDSLPVPEAKLSSTLHLEINMADLLGEISEAQNA